MFRILILGLGLIILFGVSALDSAPAFAQAYRPDTCSPGLVWREAVAGDHECVTPEQGPRQKNRKARRATDQLSPSDNLKATANRAG